jgi:hypothetical protein
MGSSVMAVLAASPASASSAYMTDAGSATTYNMMVALFGGTQTDGTTVTPAGQTPALNSIMPGFNGDSTAFPGPSENIPSGTDCAGVTFGAGTGSWSAASGGFASLTSGNPAPNGSTQGKDALYDEELGYAVSGGTNDSACYDIARSSSAPTNPVGAPDTTNMQYFAYALDAVSFLVGSDATANLPPGTPAQLTLQEVYNIYDCSVTNWKNVVVGYTAGGQPIKGANASIYRFWPQSGSGTLKTAQNMLSSVNAAVNNPNSTAFDPTTQINNPGTGGNPNCANSILGYAGPFISEENSESVIATSSAADDAGAIFPYSVGQFEAQWNNSTDYSEFAGNFDPSLSIADLADLGTLTNDALPYVYGNTGVSANGNPNYPFPAYLKWSFTTGTTGNPFTAIGANAVAQVNQSVVTEGNEWYEFYGTTQDIVPGIRYVYNVVDSQVPTFGAALQLVGFNNSGSTEGGVPTGTISKLCSDTAIGPSSSGTPAAIISGAGFVPLGTVAPINPAINVDGHCRELVP